MEYLMELLSDSERTGLIISNLANYIVYFYPGILSIYFYDFLEARTTRGTQALLVKGFALSYLYNLIIGVGLRLDFTRNAVAYNLTLVVTAGLLPYVWHRFIESKCFKHICDFLKIYTCTTSVPFKLLKDEEEETYAWFKVYLKDAPYAWLGAVEGHEYEAEIKYIILSGYKKYLIAPDGKERQIAGYEAEAYKEKVLIKFEDIRVIEKIAEERAKSEIYHISAGE